MNALHAKSVKPMAADEVGALLLALLRQTHVDGFDYHDEVPELQVRRGWRVWDDRAKLQRARVCMWLVGLGYGAKLRRV